jgi:hypothetical protein
MPRPRLRYADVMATMAVFIALGGSSYAIATGSVGSRELKNDTVRSTDLRNNDIHAVDVRNGTLTGADVKDDALTGADIRESTLRTVPSARTATTAGAARRATRADGADRATRAHSADLAAALAAPERFHEVGTPGEPPFNPGCANDTGNPSFPSVGFYKDREGVVRVKGAYTCTTAGSLVFNLPPGDRPASGKAHTQAIACFGGGNCPASHTTLVQVIGSGFAPGADGGIFADATIAVLDGITFRAAS